MRHEEVGEAARTTRYGAAGLHHPLCEVVDPQPTHHHAGITIAELVERIHLLLAGRNEDRGAAIVRDVAAGALSCLGLGDWDSGAIEPKALRRNRDNRRLEAKLVQDDELGILQSMQGEVGDGSVSRTRAPGPRPLPSL